MKTLEQRFWEKVNRTDSCWVWLASKDKHGYGRIGIGRKRPSIPAQRVSWFIEHGEFPKDCVLHKCDNPSCVNPSHLFTGDRGDNIRDCVSKGRHGGMKKTHCPAGHPYEAENLYRYKTGRHCRECNRLAAKRYYDKKVSYEKA